MTPAENNLNESTASAQDQLLSDILQRFSQNNQTPQQAPPSTDIFSSLLSNTDLISKLPQIISIVKPMLELLGNPPMQAPEHAKSDHKDITPALPAHPAAAARAKNDADRTALLCAMKPYLSKDRQNAIDYIIKLSRLGDILKTL